MIYTRLINLLSLNECCFNLSCNIVNFFFCPFRFVFVFISVCLSIFCVVLPDLLIPSLQWKVNLCLILPVLTVMMLNKVKLFRTNVWAMYCIFSPNFNLNKSLVREVEASTIWSLMFNLHTRLSPCYSHICVCRWWCWTSPRDRLRYGWRADWTARPAATTSSRSLPWPAPASSPTGNIPLKLQDCFMFAAKICGGWIDWKPWKWNWKIYIT